MLSGIAAAGIKFYFDGKQSFAVEDSSVALYAMEKTAEAGINFISASEYYWLWFLAGTFFSFVLFIMLKIMLNYGVFEQ